jgi:hypothetical protein
VLHRHVSLRRENDFHSFELNVGPLPDDLPSETAIPAADIENAQRARWQETAHSRGNTLDTSLIRVFD